MKYWKLDELKSRRPTENQLPFAKRVAFKDEKEFRLVFVSMTEALSSKSVSLPIAAFERVVLSPWLPEALASEVIRTINQIPDFPVLEVIQSKVIDSPAWRKVAASFA